MAEQQLIKSIKAEEKKDILPVFPIKLEQNESK